MLTSSGKNYCSTEGKVSSEERLIVSMSGYRDERHPRFSGELAKGFIAWLLISSEQSQIAANATEQKKSKRSANCHLKQRNKSSRGLPLC